MSSDLVRISKFLSLVLRHKPESIGLELDENGWASVGDLLRLAKVDGQVITRETLDCVVRQNDKRQFVFSEDGFRIRASQGHSIHVDLELKPVVPPALLYHGTATRFIDSIREKGLVSGKRQHVHLSSDEVTANKVGQRHGSPIVLTVNAGEMHLAAIAFYLSANGVWLTEAVPVKYLMIPNGSY